MNINEKHKKRGRKTGGKKKFIGLIEFARLVGRSKGHVYLVLNGERDSPLREQYWDWRKKRESIKP